ncbi:magnesium transporter NIPA [Chloropicon primus]|uniref:Probable magnesium transporter n=1 Tax=Chloropicon primus TaxID=1764295 RepID=A0A5B8MCC3_9CHLO|nr:magnesium transporter NIPA [Chloropicon primus]UPQ97338.1 magnesium transporter NIPA [Chloropicon primus]|eukprot:QDZ18126.1 magnesium transporter NIPA [Chloropicon primus]
MADKSQDNFIGLVLAASSSAFIGSSFVVKKKGLKKAGASGIRAGQGGYGYLKEPLWWIGMISMILGEAANFAAYAFAPAILVTPLGALSIVVSAILAHHFLQERLNVFGMVGCVLCIAGSVSITLHAPEEREMSGVNEVLLLALQPDFLLYALSAVSAALYLMFKVAPKFGKTHIFVNVGICSLFGSLSVISCKALGMAIKMTFEGNNQFGYPATYLCMVIVACCVVIQINYLNKALDLFNSAIVSPIYYVMFTVLVIIASTIMFKEQQTTRQVATQFSGFITIVSGTFILHMTKDMDLTGSIAGFNAKGQGPVAKRRGPEELPILSRETKEEL